MTIEQNVRDETRLSGQGKGRMERRERHRPRRARCRQHSGRDHAAAWADGNGGTAGTYQVDHDQHWTPSSPEYQWLAADLASHPGSVKMAVFHYPLRSDNSTETSDTTLQNTGSNPSSLEALLSSNGVQLAFNGHAHTYQRINPRQTGQITNYVTGGGGGVLESVDTGPICTNLLNAADVYALGWSPSGAGPGGRSRIKWPRS